MGQEAAPRWKLRYLVRSIEHRYRNAGLASEWGEEREPIIWAVRYLAGELRLRYTAKSCIAVAGSRFVLKLTIPGRPEEAVVKVCRPIERAAKLVAKESKSVRGLSHQNIIRIIEAGVVPKLKGATQFDLPFTVEEYVPGGKNLDDWIEERAGGLSSDEGRLALLKRVRAVALQLFDGVDYLHNHGVFHCDIKPENILVTSVDSKPTSRDLVKVIDFGYAHRLIPGVVRRSESRSRTIAFTWKYAWPRLRRYVQSMASPNAVISVRMSDFSYSRIDLYALGRTIEDLVVRIRHPLSVTGGTSDVHAPVPRSGASLELEYLERYLLLVAGRLKGTDSYTDEEFRGLIALYPEDIVSKIEYADDETALQEASEDLLRSEHNSLADYAPEWDPGLGDRVRVGNVDVPLTPRLRSVINHPAFSRLARVTQLGLANYVYPGARHSRLEHSLGTYAWACRYLQSLWAQQRDPFFRCVTHQDAAVAVSLASLLHDLGQYPHAHDIEDALPGLRPHSDLAQDLYRRSWRIGGVAIDSLHDVIAKNWSHDVAREVGGFLTEPPASQSQGQTREAILWGILSGTIDADKLDYVQRDSINLGIAYGGSVEAERLILSLRPVIRRDTPQQRGAISLGVSAKGVLPAHSLVVAREQMFERVYWHKTVRAFKAMLASALRRRGQAVGRVQSAIDKVLVDCESGDRHVAGISFPESMHLSESDIDMIHRLRMVVEGDRPAEYLIDQILRRRPYRPFLDLGLSEWQNPTDRALVLGAIEPLRHIITISPEHPEILERARDYFQELLFAREFIRERDPFPAPTDHDASRSVAVLLDIPRERLAQSTLFVISDDPRREEADVLPALGTEREVDLGVLSGEAAAAWVRSIVPRVYLNSNFRAEPTKPSVLVDLLRQATEMARRSLRAPSGLQARAPVLRVPRSSSGRSRLRRAVQPGSLPHPGVPRPKSAPNRLGRSG